MSVKTEMLNLLLRESGFVSGESAAENLGVSRAAVWKAISSLRAEGYEIQAVTNRGYRLLRQPDRLTAQDILSSAGFPGCAAIVLEITDSTNIYAKVLAAEGAKSWTIVSAETQTGGRGRYGRSFFSPTGCGAYFSVVLRPDELSITEPTMLTVMAAVAVYRAVLELSGLNLDIKWVNDLFLGGKKVCGILSEAVTNIETGEIDCVVIGIGVNFVLSPALPPELSEIVGALFDEAPHLITRSRLIGCIVSQLKAIVENPAPHDFLDTYRERSMLLGKEIGYTKAGRQNEATAIRIDDSGALIIRLPDGTMEALHSGEVSVRTRGR